MANGTAVICVMSAKGAPGATTTAPLLASRWPVPSVLLDAVPLGGDLALRMHHSDARSMGPEGGPPPVVAPGESLPEQVAKVVTEILGHDLIIDVGQVQSRSEHLSLVRSCDLLLCVYRPTAWSALHTRRRIESLAAALAGCGVRIGIVGVATSHQEADRRLASAAICTGLESVEDFGGVALDPRAVVVFEGVAVRRAGRTTLARSGDAVAGRIHARLSPGQPRRRTVGSGRHRGVRRPGAAHQQMVLGAGPEPHHATDDVRRAAFLDHALLRLAEDRAAGELAMPDVGLVLLDDDQVVLHVIGRPVAPGAPWTTDPELGTWTLRRARLSGAAAAPSAPYPCLVRVATSNGRDLLVDLELAPGLVAVAGDAVGARDLAIAMARDLSTRSRPGLLEVAIVGFETYVSGLGPGPLQRFAELDDLLAHLAADRAGPRPIGLGRGTPGSVLTDLGVHGVLHGRRPRATGAGRRLVVFLSRPPSAEQARRLPDLMAELTADLTAGGPAACSVVTVVCVGSTREARWRFVVDDAGRVESRAIGLHGRASGLGFTPGPRPDTSRRRSVLPGGPTHWRRTPWGT